ncbi:MAG: hypothetical protein EOO05_12880, partial [Chitinophagaceae bacterium]
MQFKKTLIRLLVFIFPVATQGQVTFLAQGDKQNILVERLEIKAQTDSVLNFSKTRPYSRLSYVLNGIRSFRQKNPDALSRVDEYNIRSAWMNNLDYVPAEEREQYNSRKPVLKNFYTSPANLYEVHIKDFDLVINPVIQYTLSKEKDNDQSLFLNTRGLTLRGNIAKKIGFFAYMTDNQERDPAYVQEYIAQRSAVPG